MWLVTPKSMTYLEEVEKACVSLSKPARAMMGLEADFSDFDIEKTLVYSPP